jgi:hypothetical protein
MRRTAASWIRQGLAVLGLAVFVGCGDFTSLAGPTSPSPPAPPKLGPKPDVAGVWRGEVTVLDCWRVHGDGPDPCNSRRGRVDPVALTISHFPSQVPDVDLRIVFEAFVPVARGTCYGTRDGSGAIFFQGLITRSQDQFDAFLTFRGQLDGDHMESLDETLSVNVTLRNSVGTQSLSEEWKFSLIARQ